MTPKTMTEKDMFLQTFERECQTTLKILRAYPPGEGELTPHERSKSARELAWIFILEQIAIAKAVTKGPARARIQKVIDAHVEVIVAVLLDR